MAIRMHGHRSVRRAAQPTAAYVGLRRDGAHLERFRLTTAAGRIRMRVRLGARGEREGLPPWFSTA